GGLARFGKTYAGEPGVIAEELSRDAAVREADTVLLTIPNQLGVEYNVALLRTIAEQVAPAIGWAPRRPAAAWPRSAPAARRRRGSGSGSRPSP
ncbi:MAG TPA: hypothetical protein VH276_16565, partial [Solirubrobacteraceae bacterium]|nr:hypothetical protein [Solirubrobacteraceae bacterium]